MIHKCFILYNVEHHLIFMPTGKHWGMTLDGNFTVSRILDTYLADQVSSASHFKFALMILLEKGIQVGVPSTNCTANYYSNMNFKTQPIAVFCCQLLVP